MQYKGEIAGLRTINLRIDERDYMELEKIASQLKVSKSWLIRRFVHQGLMGIERDPILRVLMKAPYVDDEENEELTRFLDSYDPKDWDVVHREEV